ncbi:MAG: 50S ribosomal protein L10 [Chloroflexi bacterium]|nr:50S ribosomal protein L10 [Chloroflexota bacterium]
MAISKARKDELVAQYTELIKESQAIFMTEYKGMNVKKMEILRDEVVKAEGHFHITKNTLLKIALEQTDHPVPEEILTGQIATGFAMNEVPTLAKTLVDFAKTDENLSIRGAIVSGRILTAAEVETLAKLPSLDQLRAQLIGIINAPATNVASVIANGVRQIINVIDAYAKSEDSAEAAEAPELAEAA